MKVVNVIGRLAPQYYCPRPRQPPTHALDLALLPLYFQV